MLYPRLLLISFLVLILSGCGPANADVEKFVEELIEKMLSSATQGDKYAENGEYDLAIQSYTEAITRGSAMGFADIAELADILASTYNGRGIAYAQKGEHDLAIRDYTKVIALNPEHVSAYYNRGMAYLHKREWSSAEADLTTVKNEGYEAAAMTDAFQERYGSLEEFEEKYNVEVPSDIEALLKPPVANP